MSALIVISFWIMVFWMLGGNIYLARYLGKHPWIAGHKVGWIINIAGGPSWWIAILFDYIFFIFVGHHLDE